MTPILYTESLAVGYRKRPVAAGINVSLKCGSVTAMIGRNGAGKSTLIKTLDRTIPALEGAVWIGGNRLESMSRRKLATLMAEVTTDPHIAGGLRLMELVGLGRIPYTGRMGILSKDDASRIEEAIASVGLSGKEQCFVGELSDGERQKGMIARGLVQDTPVLVLDEPFAYLDVASRLEIMAMIKKLSREKQKAILFSSHEVTEAIEMADSLWLFTMPGHDGTSQVMEGTPEELIRESALDMVFPDKNVKFDIQTKTFRLKL